MKSYLFCRSANSLYQSTIRIHEYVKQAKEYGYEHIVLSDHNVMYGIPTFLDACKKYEIHGIIGLEVDVSYEDGVYPFLLLAKNTIGYQNLMHLSSIVMSEKRPITMAELKTYSNQTCLIVYGEGGIFESALIKEQQPQIYETLLSLKEQFHSFDVALCANESMMWKSRNQMLKGIAQSLEIPTVAINKTYYLNQEDVSAYRVFYAMKDKKSLQDYDIPADTGRYLWPITMMEQSYNQEECDRADTIAQSCVLQYTDTKTKLPTYPKKKDEYDSASYLKALCQKGLEKRCKGNIPNAYQERLAYELKTIHDMSFDDYFLIVYDYVLYAKKNGIAVGPGRGSATGSLVSYCLGITDIDPMQYGLLFERFLNPERISMPDIDTDFQDNRRNEVVAYVEEKYGQDHVALVHTMNTLGVVNAMRDIAKVMGIYEADVQDMIRYLPRKNNEKMSVQKIWNSDKRFQSIILSKPKYTELWQYTTKLVGLPIDEREHPSGIVIGQDPIEAITPIRINEEGAIVSQYNTEYLESCGLIKMDLLSLHNLTIIHDMIDKIHLEHPHFDLRHIPLDDEKTMSVFQHGDTLGIFQFESEGMQNFLRRMQPKRYEDVAIARALYNPSSNQSISLYLQNRAHPEAITYLHDSLKPILEETYGVMVYQEQVMQTARLAAGFSLAKADLFRKAIAKKDDASMQKMKDSFIHGCLNNGYTEDQANAIYEYIEPFTGYGFNKAHAYAYGLISYQMAYLKAHAPLIFYQQLLQANISNQKEMAKYIYECKKRGITFVYPDINQAKMHVSIKNQQMILPLQSIRGISQKDAQSIEEDKQKNGIYDEFFACIARLQVLKIQPKTMEALIDGGALDSLGYNRTTMRHHLQKAIEYAQLIQVYDGDQMALNFNLVSKPAMINMAKEERLESQREQDSLGFLIGAQPIEKKRDALGIHASKIYELQTMQGLAKGFAQIEYIRETRTKKGEMMAFLSIKDETGSARLIVWPKQYQAYKDAIVRGEYIGFDVRIKENGDMYAETITNYGK